MLVLHPDLSFGESSEAVPALYEPPIETLSLENGLEVLLQPDPRHNRVAVSITYDVGHRDQPPGFRGIAHLTEHLMFQGSLNVGEDQYFSYLQNIGATDINAITSTDNTTYWEVVPSYALPLALWLESDRMAYMLEHLNEQTLAQQRAVVLAEHEEGFGSSPLARLPFVIREAIFPSGHPYRIRTDDAQELAWIQMEHVQWFFQRWYAPHNARLAIVGGFDLDEARALVHQYFGSIRAAVEPGPRATVDTPVVLQGERRITFHSANPHVQVVVAWPTPAFFHPGDAELDYVMHLLSRGPVSRLEQRLVTEMGAARGVNARQASEDLRSLFRIHVTLVEGFDPHVALGVIDEEIRRLGTELVEDTELERVRQTIETEVILSSEDLSSRAHMLSAFVCPLAPDGGFRPSVDLERYPAITQESIAAAVRDHLPLDRRVVVFVHPSREVGVEGLVTDDTILPASSVVPQSIARDQRQEGP